MLRLPTVQTWLSYRIAGYLSDKLHTRVNVKGVDIELFKKVVLEDLYIEDLHKDTLLYARKFKMDIDGFEMSKHLLNLNSIHINDAKFYLKTYLNEKEFNLDFILNAFASADTTPSSSPVWTVKSKEIQLHDISFINHDYNEPPTPEGVDYWNLKATHINGTLTNIKLVGDTIKGTIKNLSLVEKSNFILSNFSADVVLHSKMMKLDNLIVETPQTKVATDLVFLYDRYQDFYDFNNKVSFKSKFKKSTIKIKDIAFFAPALIGYDQSIILSGEINGKINQLKGKNLFISYGKETYVKGNFNLTGLPNIEETFIDCKVEELQTTKEDMERIQTYPFYEKKYLKLPENIALLHTISFHGKFTGFYNDFVAYGNFGTALGEIKSDINLKLSDNSQKTSYDGHLALNNFDIGRFLDQSPLLGAVSLNVNLKGRGFQKNDVKAELNGKVNELRVNNYKYKNIKLSGDISKGLFVGDVSAKDENIDFDFSGSIDISKTIPVFDFTSNIRMARLQRLRLVNRDTSSNLSTKLAIHFSGNTIDNIEGSINIRNTQYLENGKTYILNNLTINANDSNKQFRVIELTSDYADAYIKGEYKVDAAFDAVRQFIANYLPALSKTTRSYRSTNELVDFSIKLKNTTAISNLFFPSLQIKPNASVTGSFNSGTNDLTINGSFPEIIYNKNSYRNCYVKTSVENKALVFNAGSNKLIVSDSTIVNDIKLTAIAQHDSVLLQMQVANNPKEVNKANIKGVLTFENSKKFDFKFLPSNIILENGSWAFSKGNKIQVDSSRININNFNITNGEQSLNVQGVVSENLNDQLKIGFSNFDLSNLDQLSFSKFNGIVNGDALITGFYSGLRFSSNLNISNLTVNGDTLGNASLISLWDNKSKIIGIVANVTKGSIKTVDIKGQYNIGLETNNLDFDIVVQKFYLNILNKYLADYVSNIRGIASAELKLKGNLKKPVLTGLLRLQKTSFVYKYLNTKYNLADEVVINENEIYFKNVVLNDVNGNTASVTGRISHNYFRDFKFDLTVLPNNFQTLNTSSYENALYYGTAYTTGSVYIRGTTDNLKLKVDVKSNRGTKIFIPLSNTDEISEGTFITFVSHDTTAKTKVINAPIVDLSGITLNMDLEVTPEAEIQLIFDEKIGDKIKVEGSGNINMEINTRGDFNMYGSYIIDQGDYLFTLQNIINKKFKVEQGGSIRWTGNPHDADINMTAVYQVRAPLYDLTLDSTQKNRIPVNCKLQLTNNLMNPTIKFDVEVPNLNDDYTTNLIKKYIYTDQDKTNQVFSLLMIGRFKSPNDAIYNNNGASATSGFGANASELLSSQLSNWASQISSDVNIGVNYRAKDGISKEQIEVALSTQLFNDRVVIDGNFGVAGNNNSNASVINGNQPNNNIVGDFNTEYKIFQDGRLRLKGFNRTNTNVNVLISNSSPYTQGFGIFYREEYNSLKELIERYKHKQPKDKKE